MDPDTYTETRRLAINGDLEGLMRLGKPVEFITYYASRHGHIHLLEWARNCITSTCHDYAIIGNQFPVLEWLEDNGYNGCGVNMTVMAAKTGNIPALQWCLDHGYKFSNEVLDYAVDQPETIEWLKSRSHTWSRNALVIAVYANASEKHLSLLEGGDRARGIQQSFHAAIRNRNLRIVTWLYTTYSDDIVNDETVCIQAVQNCKDTTILDWLKENGFSWGEEIMHLVVKYGNVKSVQWFRINHLTIWDENLFETAVKYSDLEVLQWLVNPVFPEEYTGDHSGCPYNKSKLLTIESEMKEFIDALP